MTLFSHPGYPCFKTVENLASPSENVKHPGAPPPESHSELMLINFTDAEFTMVGSVVTPLNPHSVVILNRSVHFWRPVRSLSFVFRVMIASYDRSETLKQ